MDEHLTLVAKYDQVLAWMTEQSVHSTRMGRACEAYLLLEEVRELLGPTGWNLREDPWVVSSWIRIGAEQLKILEAVRPWEHV